MPLSEVCCAPRPESAVPPDALLPSLANLPVAVAVDHELVARVIARDGGSVPRTTPLGPRRRSGVPCRWRRIWPAMPACFCRSTTATMSSSVHTRVVNLFRCTAGQRSLEECVSRSSTERPHRCLTAITRPANQYMLCLGCNRPRHDRL